MFDAGAIVIAELQAEWRRELELLQAQSREILASMRAEMIERLASFGADVTRRLADLHDGEPGRNGRDGEPGPIGARGEPGERGTDGAPGAAGPQGEQGPRGEPGHNGATGAAGAPGAKGDIGEPGRNGAMGERGLPGAKGDKGDAGSPGLMARVAPWTDRVCYEGELATHLGSTWQAECDTAKEPGTSENWRLIAAAGTAGRSLNVRGTYSAAEKYAALDVVTLDHGWFVARRDNPGPIPGPGWQSGPVGKRGEKGLPGDRGPKGDVGTAAPHWVGAKLEDKTLVAVLSDGTIGPRINLQPMFEDDD